MDRRRDRKPNRFVRSLIRFLKSLQPGLVALGAFWGLNPPFRWGTEAEPDPPQQSSLPRPSCKPGHPERLVPHLPLTPAEWALWSQLTCDALGDQEPGHADRPH